MFRERHPHTDAKCEVEGCNSRWQHKLAYGATKDQNRPRFVCTYHAERVLDMRHRARRS